MIGKTISHYKILEKLGEGGMGVVYKAEDTKLDRLVALKFIPAHISLNTEEKKRFVHEAKAAAALNHVNIVTIHEINEFEGQTYIAMEYLEDKTVKDKTEEQPIPINEAVDTTVQIAENLSPVPYSFLLGVNYIPTINPNSQISYCISKHFPYFLIQIFDSGFFYLKVGFIKIIFG